MPINYKLSSNFHQSIYEIWEYSNSFWGEAQADKYYNGIMDKITQLSESKSLWRKLEDFAEYDVYYNLHEHHYIFFRELSNNKIGILDIIHVKRNFLAILPESVKFDF